MTNAEAMNSVTERKQRRRFILTKHVMAGIPVLVQQGMNAEAIAARLGCKVGTLKVRCSQAGISLRVPKEVNVVAMVPLAPASEAPKQPKQKRSYPLPCRAHCNSTKLRCPSCASGRKQSA